MVLFTEEKLSIPKRSYPKMLTVFKDIRLRRYLILNLAYFTTMSFAWPLLPFIVIEKLGMKIWQIAGYSVCSSVLSIISQRYLGAMIDKVGIRPLIIFTRISNPIIPLVYAFATSWTHIFIVEATAGIIMGAWMISTNTYILDLAPQGMRATYLATNSAIFGLAAFIGPILGGYVTDFLLSAEGFANGISIALLVSAILRIPLALLYLKIFETRFSTT
jgi:MFS family permease